MKNKVAVVTGGMGGIGTAVCQSLSKQGIQVIATYHRNGDHENAKAWQQEQQKSGHIIDIQYADVTSFESCKSMAESILHRYQTIDVLVNNAGTTRDVMLHKMNLEQWQTVLRTNLDSLFNVTRHFINSMIDNAYGRVINISSISGQKGQYGQANYAASKAGIHGFTKSLAQEVSKKGITVNTISPGYIETQMVMAVPVEIRQKIVNQIPVGRLGRPEEIARAVCFLADEESGFITGTNLVINGGQYLL